MKRNIVALTSATVWISVSEFVRNQVVFLNLWEDHYASKGLVFETKPIKGVVWGIWSLLFAFILHSLLRKFNFKATFVLGWLIAFGMMWLVIGNLGVLPYTLLWFAVPLSIFETAGAIWLIRKYSSK